MEDRVEDAPISTGRTVAAAIAAVAVVAGCLTSYRINPVVPLVIGPMYLLLIFDFYYGDVERSPIPRPGPEIVIAAATGGLAGFIAGAIADHEVAAALAQQAHAAAIGCRAKTFGGCGIGMLGVGLLAVVGIPILILVTSAVLPLCRVRLGFIAALMGGTFAVLIALPVTAVLRPSPGEFWLAYAAIGGAGYALAAIAWRRTLSPIVRTIAGALPMLAVSLYALM